VTGSRSRAEFLAPGRWSFDRPPGRYWMLGPHPPARRWSLDAGCSATYPPRVPHARRPRGREGFVARVARRREMASDSTPDCGGSRVVAEAQGGLEAARGRQAARVQHRRCCCRLPGSRSERIPRSGSRQRCPSRCASRASQGGTDRPVVPRQTNEQGTARGAALGAMNSYRGVALLGHDPGARCMRGFTRSWATRVILPLGDRYDRRKMRFGRCNGSS
jgi:hypothetical protein